MFVVSGTSVKPLKYHHFQWVYNQSVNSSCSLSLSKFEAG